MLRETNSKLTEIPPAELDSLLCNFYITAKKKDNTEYERPLTKPGSNRIGSDRIGLTRAGSDRIGLTKAGSDRTGLTKPGSGRILLNKPISTY